METLGTLVLGLLAFGTSWVSDGLSVLLSVLTLVFCVGSFVFLYRRHDHHQPGTAANH